MVGVFVVSVDIVSLLYSIGSLVVDGTEVLTEDAFDCDDSVLRTRRI